MAMAHSPVRLPEEVPAEHRERRFSQQENLGTVLTSHVSSFSEAVAMKPKALPTVTPKRFTRFFTPRSLGSGRGSLRSKAGRQLRDITKNGANRRRSDGKLHSLSKSSDFEDPQDGPERVYKRQRRSVDIPSSPPLQSSPLKHVQCAALDVTVFEDVATSPTVSVDDDDLTGLLDTFMPFPSPVRRVRQRGATQRLLQRSFGGYEVLSRGVRAPDHAADWRASTAGFVSTPSDSHRFLGTALPFCTASCNTNSLIAIGEEEGGVRLIDSASTSDFATFHVAFRPHHNAIMDLAFSSDDYMLATASGDQTARVIDMHTQTTTCILSGHRSSVKQIRFHPNDDKMLTSSSRDGSVQIWDLRCCNSGSVQTLETASARRASIGGIEPVVKLAKSTLEVGHTYRPARYPEDTYQARYSDVAGVSITAIQHLLNGREHLLMTSSELNSSIKLWDLRHTSRRTPSTPLSSTLVPPSHNRTRNYGTNAMVLSSDGARLYALCRDSTVYAYSTNHLILGNAPEMASSKGRGRMPKSPKEGLGPLYGLRNPALRTGTFYIKAAMRKASGKDGEMLAVGSSEQCAVLFPTDESSLLPRTHQLHREDQAEEDAGELPSLDSRSIKRTKSASFDDGMPIYEHGTALVRGHGKEVTSICWTHDGDLVTVADDFRARCWRQDDVKARELRGCGEGEGRRWDCGWADLDASWDEDF